MNTQEQFRRVYISDYDGTWTDPDKEAGVYRDIAYDWVVKEFNIPRTRLEELMSEAVKMIDADPNTYGWLMGGHIVAPGRADHFVESQTALRIVIDMLRKEQEGVSGSVIRLPESDQVAAFLGKMFGACYGELAKHPTPYRDGVMDFYRMLSESGRLVIVTNSKPDKVLIKLSHLVGEDRASQIELAGDAKKTVIDLGWLDVFPVGPDKNFPGFPNRGIHLQRRDYYTVLSNLVGGDFSQIAGVVGDIPELDMLMVDRLGVRTALAVGNPVTHAPWEVDYYTRLANGQRFASRDLREIAQWLING